MDKLALGGRLARLGKAGEASRMARELNRGEPSGSSFKNPHTANNASVNPDCMDIDVPEVANGMNAAWQRAQAGASQASVATHAGPSAAMEGAWKRSRRQYKVERRQMDALRNIQVNEIQIDASSAPRADHERKYSPDGRYLWKVSCNWKPNWCSTYTHELEDMTTGATHVLAVDDDDMHSLEGMFSPKGDIFYAFNHRGCHAFDLSSGDKPQLIQSVHTAPAPGTTVARPSSSGPQIYHQRRQTILTQEHGESTFVVLKLREGPSLFELKGHTAPVRSICTSNFVDDIVTISDNEALWWRFENDTAISTPVPGVTSNHNSHIEGQIVDDKTLLLTQSDLCRDKIKIHGLHRQKSWKLVRCQPGQLPQVSQIQSPEVSFIETKNGEFFALQEMRPELGEKKFATTIVQRTARGNTPSEVTDVDQPLCGYGNPRLFRIAGRTDDNFLWVGDGGSVERLTLSHSTETGGKKQLCPFPTLSDNHQQAFCVVDGALQGWDLSGSNMKTLALPALPPRFRVKSVTAENGVVVVAGSYNHDGDTRDGFFWPLDNSKPPQPFKFEVSPQTTPWHGVHMGPTLSATIAPGGQSMAFVAGGRAYLMSLLTPGATPTLLAENDKDWMITGTAFAANGTVAVVQRTDYSGVGRSRERGWLYIDLAVRPPRPALPPLSMRPKL